MGTYSGHTPPCNLKPLFNIARPKPESAGEGALDFASQGQARHLSKTQIRACFWRTGAMLGTIHDWA